MTFSMNVVEFTWIGLNLVALVLTLILLIDAGADRKAVRLLNGKARELAATGTVRREWFRLITQTLLLAVAVPGLFSDREVVFTPIVAALIAVPAVLLLSSFLDYRDRKIMVVLVTADVLLLRNTALDRIEALVIEGKHVAEQAYDAANHTKERFDKVTDAIAAQGLVQAAQGDEMAAQRKATAISDAALAATVDTTAEQVADLHTGEAPAKKPS